MFTKSRLTVAIMAISSGLVYAEQPAEENVTLLDQVTVSATKTTKKVGEIASSVSVVSGETIDEQLASDIKDLVRYEPGVTAGSNSRSGAGDFNIRGLARNRVKIIVDGVDMPKTFDRSASYGFLNAERNFIDTETLKKLEIVKGSASTLHGSDSMGGLVAFTTKDPADILKSAQGNETAGSIKSSYDSENKGFTETLSVANRTDELETMFIYTRRDHRETETFAGADIEGSARGKADPRDTGLDNLLAKANYQINNQHKTGVSLEYHDSQSKVDNKSRLATAAQTFPTSIDTKKRTRVSLVHDWNAEQPLFDNLNMKMDWQSSRTRMNNHLPAYQSYYGRLAERRKDYFYEEKIIKLSTQLDKSASIAGLEHEFVYGLTASKTKVKNRNTTYDLEKNTVKDDTYIPVVDVKNYGAFLRDEIKLNNRVTLSPGIRYDKFIYSPDGDATSAKEDKWTVKLGSIVQLNENTSLFAQFGQGYKAPDFDDLYYTRDGGSYRNLANPDLKAEKSNSFEIGLRGKSGLGSAELTTFYNKYRDFITSTRLNDTDTQQQNVGKVTIKGIELKSQVWLDEAFGAPAGTTFNASIAYAKGDNTEANRPFNGVSPLTGVFGLNYASSSNTWGSEAILTLVEGKKKSRISDHEASSRGPKTQFATAGYGLVDITAWYKPVRELTLRAGLLNLTDKKYHVWDDVRGRADDYEGLDRYSQPGRNFSVSAKYEF